MSQLQAERAANERPVAVVTGAGRRLGNAIARYLAARGYRLALHAQQSLSEAESTARELAASGCEAIALAADLRDEHATRKLIADARSHFGRIDALVNNAAIWISKPLEHVRAADVREHFEINTQGTFLCCQVAGLAMVDQPSGGSIVNIGDWAIARPYLDHAAYFAAKGSIPTLTRTFAVELGTRNPRVRVNAIMPGPAMLPDAMMPDERRRVIQSTLAKRAGTSLDVAHAVLFLLENTFVTGICLPVDGGRTIFAGFDDPSWND
jgi:pteridine reductase